MQIRDACLTMGREAAIKRNGQMLRAMYEPVKRPEVLDWAYENCVFTRAGILSGMSYPEIIDALARELQRRTDQLVLQAKMAPTVVFKVEQ